ncbi:MAG TPA: HAD-IB family hydrolase [Acidimicrobiales bacterium]|nr:HAD-IB family hydrolase [Acidimicrobiales bacterium]
MRAAFFDLDKTVIAKSSLVALGPEFHARGLLHRRTLVWAVLSQLLFIRFGADEQKLTKFREAVLKVTKGWDREEVRALVAETINNVIEPLIYEEALELIDHHLLQGDEVWLVSMSPSEIVEPFAELLGITGAIGSRAKIDEEGKFTGEMEFFAQGDNKAVAIRELALARGIDLAASYAYSDSETDVPMLQAVGHAFAVNPDRALARMAHDNEWPILTFSHPVRAHDRAKSHTPFLISAVIIGVAALLGQSRIRRH